MEIYWRRYNAKIILDNNNKVWYSIVKLKNAKQYLEQSETRTEIVFMDVTECAEYMEHTMIQTGLIIVAFYV